MGENWTKYLLFTLMLTLKCWCPIYMGQGFLRGGFSAKAGMLSFYMMWSNEYIVIFVISLDYYFNYKPHLVENAGKINV